MKLIANWREEVVRLWSLRLNALGSALLATMLMWPEWALYLWSMVPIEARETLPPRVVLVLPLLLFIASFVARLIRQKGPNDDQQA